jgi:hypothetical protein
LPIFDAHRDNRRTNAVGMIKVYEMVVIRQSRAQRDGLFGGLVAVFGVAFGLGAANAHTTGCLVASLLFGAAMSWSCSAGGSG